MKHNEYWFAGAAVLKTFRAFFDSSIGICDMHTVIFPIFESLLRNTHLCVYMFKSRPIVVQIPFNFLSHLQANRELVYKIMRTTLAC